MDSFMQHRLANPLVKKNNVFDIIEETSMQNRLV